MHNLSSFVPHNALNTSINLESVFLNKQHEIEYWFRKKWEENVPPFYGSVDLRHNNFKLASIDMNLYPGGFNNIDVQAIPLAIQTVSNLIERYCDNVSKILIIPENHTRNHAYLKNVYTLQYILEQAGIETRVGSLSPDITEPTEIEVIGQKHLLYYPVKRDGDKIVTSDGFAPCMILLNNDLSVGCPEILLGINQTILPPLNAGWYMRRKTNFFIEYDAICNEFSKLLQIDSWHINSYFDLATNVDFANRLGFDALANKVENILQKIRHKYDEYGINDVPYVVVKANSGTYGMGIMTATSGDEIINMNRKTRNKMAVIKDGKSVSEVIIQEGVYTNDLVNNKTAEPVIYMMNSSVIGGFYRVHGERDRNQNLNAVGATFSPLGYVTDCLKKDKSHSHKCDSKQFYAYKVVARLALLASANELDKYK